MHMILEGISKMLLNYWSHASYRDCRFYLGKEIDELDKLLFRIKPPYSFRHSLRSLHTCSTFSKVSEHRAWLLYLYLFNVLPPDYILHLSLLIASIHILLGTTITTEDLNTSQEMLTAFHELTYSCIHC